MDSPKYVPWRPEEGEKPAVPRGDVDGLSEAISGHFEAPPRWSQGPPTEDGLYWVIIRLPGECESPKVMSSQKGFSVLGDDPVSVLFLGDDQDHEELLPRIGFHRRIEAPDVPSDAEWKAVIEAGIGDPDHAQPS